MYKIVVYLHSEMVRWMSGLVTGLQNRLQRFESASDLEIFIFRPTTGLYKPVVFCYLAFREQVPERLITK